MRQHTNISAHLLSQRLKNDVFLFVLDLKLLYLRATLQKEKKKYSCKKENDELKSISITKNPPELRVFPCKGYLLIHNTLTKNVSGPGIVNSILLFESHKSRRAHFPMMRAFLRTFYIYLKLLDS